MAEDNKINLDLDKGTLEKIFKAAGLTMPEFVSEKEVQAALSILQNTISSAKPEEKKSEESKKPEKETLTPPASEENKASQPTSENEDDVEIIYKTAPTATTIVAPDPRRLYKSNGTESSKKKIVTRPRSVLIVDDLGIIVYQLNLLFKRLQFDVVVSQDAKDAINKYKAKDFGYTILDLYIPTEREGFYLLDQIKKLSLLCKLDTKILVMSATSKEAYKQKSILHGADDFIEKAQGWQKKIIEACVE